MGLSGATAKMATTDESRLLSLPLELLMRITDALKDESLPSIRLACKTLEGATFDRFVSTFSATWCCVYYESRWLSLKRFLNGSTRLVKAVRRICFTTDTLERFDCTDVQLACPNGSISMAEAQDQYNTWLALDDPPLESVHRDSPPTPALIHSVLLDIVALAPLALVDFDLTNTFYFHEEGIILYKDILLAIASTSCDIGALSLTRSCIADIEDMTAHLGTQLLSCTSGMLEFTFMDSHLYDDLHEEDLATEKLDFVADLLQNADCLSTLNLRLEEFMRLSNARSITKKLLFANDLAKINFLSLEDLHVPEKHLCRVVKSCAMSLLHLCLGGVHLTELREGWLAIFQLISTLPKLRFLSSTRLTTCEAPARRLDFKSLGDGLNPAEGLPDKRQRILLRNREDVTSGLRKLLNEPLSFIGPPEVEFD